MTTTPASPAPMPAAPLLTPGCFFSAAMLEAMRHRITAKSEPALDAWNWVWNHARWTVNSAGIYIPHAVPALNIPSPYVDADYSVETPESLAAYTAANSGLLTDAIAAVQNALAWQGSRTASFAAVTAQILRAWSTTNKSIGGASGPLSAADNCVWMVIAADLISDYPEWTEADRVSFRWWVRTILIPQALLCCTHANNWRSWGEFLKIVCYHHLGDTANVNMCIVSLSSFIRSSITTAGQLPAEQARADRAVWYTYFSLAALTAACRALREATGGAGHGTDLFRNATTGTLLITALNTLLAAFQHPATGQSMPGALDAWPYDLYEAMAAEYNIAPWAAFAAKKRPVNSYGAGYLAWPSPTLTEVV